MPTPPRIFLFVTPFASPAARRHARKLLDCLLPSPLIPNYPIPTLFALCDRRLDLAPSPLPVTHIPLPPLRYLNHLNPPLLSPLLWLLDLLGIQLLAVFHLLRLAARIDIVVCTFGAWYTPILLVARLLGKKTLIFEPGGEFAAAQSAYRSRSFWPILSILLRFATALNRRLAHRIVIESPSIIPFARLESYRRKLRFANLYIDVSLYRPCFPHVPRPSNCPPLVGFLGRLSSEKGVLNLLDAALLLHPSEASFLIAGDGPLRPEIERRLASPRLCHVHYVGWLSSADIPDFLNRLALFALPSAGEGIPNAVLEAMACGVPVLATPVGGLKDLLIEGDTGYLLPDTYPQTIVASIYRLLRDPSLPTVSRHARELVLSRYSLPAARRQWQCVLSDLHSTPDPLSPIP